MKVIFTLLGLIALFFGFEAVLSANPPILALVLLIVGANFLVGAGIIDAVDKTRPSAGSRSPDGSSQDQV